MYFRGAAAALSCGKGRDWLSYKEASIQGSRGQFSDSLLRQSPNYLFGIFSHLKKVLQRTGEKTTPKQIRKGSKDKICKDTFDELGGFDLENEEKTSN